MSYTASYIVNSSSAQGTTDFQFTFPYIKEEHIEVYLNYSKITQGSGSAQYQVITNVSPKLIRLNTGIASANLRVEVRRNSSLGSPLVDYADGSTLTANDLDTSALQSLYIDQELKDNQSKTVSVNETTGLPTLNNQRLTNVADPTAAQDAATKNYIDTKQFTSSQIQDGTLVNADVNASAAIAGTKISPNFGSQNIVTSGTVDGRDVSNDGIKLDSIETGATADQTNAEIRAAVEAASDSNVFTDADHTKLNAIEPSATADQTDAEIRAAVESATDSNVFTDADHSKLNAIEPGATADQTNAEIRAAVEAATDSNVFTDADHSKLNAIEPSATADQTASEIKTLLQSDKLTNSEIATGTLDGRYYTQTQSDSRYFNVSTGDTIKDGDTFPDNDTTIATTAAINDRIIDLVDDVGGFVPIANETSFPNANPDVNNGAGTLVSIKALSSNLTSNGSGVATISNGTVGNSTVTITGLANSTTYAANFGLIVETTSTLNTYAFHRQVPIATEVSTVAGSISNVNTVAGSISNVNTVAGNNSNISTVAGVSGNVTTVAGVASNVTTVAGISSDVTAVAADATDIGAVAAKATEIGRLGTADAVADLNTLGTTAIVSDLDTCATNVSNINTAAGSISNINTVATNISNVNDFSDKYRVASSAPTSNNDAGDLYFDTSSNELRVYNGSAWQGGVTATGNLAGLGANTFTGSQSLGDNNKVIFGTGSDLEIYHDGTDTHIDNNTGDLYITTTGTGDDIRINAIDNVSISVHTSDVALVCTGDAGVDLFYDNVKKLETTSSGVAITGVLSSNQTSGQAISLGDNAQINFGNGDDLKIYHDGTYTWSTDASTGGWHSKSSKFVWQAYDDATNMAIFHEDGAVRLWYDGSEKFATTSYGVLISSRLNAQTINIEDWNSTHETGAIKLGTSNDLQIYHDGTNTHLHNATGELKIRGNDVRLMNAAGNELYFAGFANSYSALYYDNVKKFETDGNGINVIDNDTTVEVSLTDSNGAAGHIYGNSTSGLISLQVGNGETCLAGYQNGTTQLFYDNSKKFETFANGIKLYDTDGTLIGEGFDGGFNFTSLVYVNELRLMDSEKIQLGDSQDLQIYFDGESRVKNVGTASSLYLQTHRGGLINEAASEWGVLFEENSAVKLYYDGVKKLETASDRVNITGHMISTGTVKGTKLSVDDNNKATFGDSDDLQIWHDGNNSYLTNSTGGLSLKNTSGSDLDLYSNGSTTVRVNAGEMAVDCNHNSSVDLYYDNVKKLETTSGGVNVVGALTVNGAAVGGGVWERISSYDVSGTPNAMSFSWGTSSSILTDYEKIRIELYNVKASLYTKLYLRYLDSSGNAISSDYYQWVGFINKHGNNNFERHGNGWNADTKISLLNEWGYNISGHIDIFDPFDNTTSDGPIMLNSEFSTTRKNVYNTTDGNFYQQSTSGALIEDIAWDTKIYGVQIYNATSTTNYTDGRFVLYGLKSS